MAALSVKGHRLIRGLKMRALKLKNFCFLLIAFNFYFTSQSFSSSEKEDIRGDILSKGATLVRVWKGGFDGGDHIGHVSVETRDCYISLWPAGRVEGSKKGSKLVTESSSFLERVEDDIRREERCPEWTLSLAGLNISTLKTEYNGLAVIQRGGNLKWNALGEIADESGKQHHSCASVALKLLRRSGLNELLPEAHRSTGKIMGVTPDWVGELVLMAVTRVYSKISPAIDAFPEIIRAALTKSYETTGSETASIVSVRSMSEIEEIVSLSRELREHDATAGSYFSIAAWYRWLVKPENKMEAKRVVLSLLAETVFKK